MANTVRIMLDSGAFSAWTRGEELKLDEYISFVRRYEKHLDTYINLDVIPGTRNRAPTDKEVERSAAASFENYEGMLAVGLNPIPVFHYGEEFSWLEKLLESGAKYICIGGTVGTPAGIKRKFFDDCFTILTNSSGKPYVKVHGLGVTDATTVMRYPWQSVDSTSWLIAPCHGLIIIPMKGDDAFGKQIYLGNSKSKRLGWGVEDSGPIISFDRLSPRVQEHVVKFAEQCGVSMTDLRNDVYSRMHLFVQGLLLLQDQAAKVFLRKRASFTLPEVSVKRAAVKTNFRMIFAGDTTTHHDSILTMCDAVDRLWSYYSYRDDGERLISRIAEQSSAEPYAAENRTVQRAKWDSKNYHDHRRRQLAARGIKQEEYVEGSE